MNVALRSLVASLALSAAVLCQAEIKAVWEVYSGEEAKPEFKFKDIPEPSRTDAANRAKFTILDGRRDSNGGDLDRLNDGRTPSEEDEPRANFFFAAGSAGGRLLVDLGKATDIRQIVTYSWHPGPRGPQLYKLYANDSEARDFDPKSGREGDPTAAGWKLLADVDTRPEEGEPGGQYGVSIADEAKGAIGKHRWLLFDIARTGGDEYFDNTFFSEIDILDGKKHPPAAAPPKGEVDVLKVGDKYEIAFDTSQVPELKPWVDEKLKPICAQWYPKIVEMLPSGGYEAPAQFAIVFHKDMRGVANTGGRRINCAAEWFQNNLDGEAAGAVVHEMVHVVQQYGGRRGGNRSPGWMVEGLADYIRWFLYEPENLRPRPDPERANYTDSYRTTAAFLNYVVHEHDNEAIKKFNAAMREGNYSDDLFQQYTGKSAEELWAEYARTLREDGK